MKNLKNIIVMTSCLFASYAYAKDFDLTNSFFKEIDSHLIEPTFLEPQELTQPLSGTIPSDFNSEEDHPEDSLIDTLILITHSSNCHKKQGTDMNPLNRNTEEMQVVVEDNDEEIFNVICTPSMDSAIQQEASLSLYNDLDFLINSYSTSPSEEKQTAPRIGIFYQPKSFFRVPLTEDDSSEHKFYVIGAFYSLKESFNIQKNIRNKEERQFYGGMEFVKKNLFSVKFGSSYHDPSYQMKASLTKYPIKFDYTFRENRGYKLTVRIRRSFF